MIKITEIEQPAYPENTGRLFPMWMWTDYPFTELGDTAGEEAPIRNVYCTWFDGNKYATVTLPGGIKSEVKWGYLYHTKAALRAARKT